MGSNTTPPANPQVNLLEMSRKLNSASPHAILEWAIQTYRDKLAVVTSFQPTGIVTLHILSKIAPHIPVLTLDTELLFPETYALIDELETRLALNLIRVKPALSVEQQQHEYGEALWERDPDTCCQLRKVAPLAPALVPYDAWITGLRRDQSGRSQIPIVTWDKKYQKIKLCPFANWTAEMIWIYIRAHELPYNSLHDQGYPSIGCNTPTCTQPVTHSSDQRAGRWVNHSKTECGLHSPHP
jgi:phosphoadenosine phosphosulfate reductase